MGDEDARWSPGRGLGSTFIGLFLCINIIPLMLVSIPIVSGPIAEVWMAVWAGLTPVLGQMVGIDGPISTVPSGSSDMTWNYLQQLAYVVIAALAATAWAIRERRRSAHATAHAWMRIIIRYGLASVMFSYGFIKVFCMQFEALGPVHLARTYGESSPGGLLWSFMGFSPAYQAFTGLAEVLAGALLLSRRTTTLGALVATGVMANVAMMNFCYDVPVKIYSSLFLLMALYLAGHDARRIVDVFARNRAVGPADLSAPALGRRLGLARVVAKAGFLLTVAWTPVELSMAYAGRQAQAADPPPLYGAWEVERFTLDGVDRPPADELRWRQFAVPQYPVALIRRARGEPQLFALAHDTGAGTLTLTALDATQTTLVLAAARPTTEELVLTGPLGSGTAEIRLRRIDTEHAPLMTRGFHWITEVPYNR